jgi:predicted O-methyltransferase YrrM
LNLLSELGLESPCDVLLLALQLVRSGNYPQAIQLCKAARDEFGSEPSLEVALAMAEFGLGHGDSAQERLSSVRAEHPSHLVGLFTLAWMHGEAGNTRSAIQELLEVIRVYPDYPGALGALSTLLMPGPSYRDVLGYIHHALAPKTYLEIGVETGATLSLAKTAERIVGIDPNLTAVRKHDLDARARLYEATSDEFFAMHTVSDVFEGRPLDLAFIDGMHRFEYAIRDFCNVELWSNADTTVVIHDVLPVLPIVAERERQTKFWVGDVWKALWLLVEERNDLTIRVIPTPPSGLAVIRGLNHERKCDPSHFASALERYAGLAYSTEDIDTFPKHIAIVANTKLGWDSALGLGGGS